ncbi:hypothetical protein BDW22DRAFT_999843 [Trametopsis cervina]|nr:hypothetical protein BDW22DRAFT_999843 [Trametopsis cervina]
MDDPEKFVLRGQTGDGVSAPAEQYSQQSFATSGAEPDVPINRASSPQNDRDAALRDPSHGANLDRLRASSPPVPLLSSRPKHLRGQSTMNSYFSGTTIDGSPADNLNAQGSAKADSPNTIYVLAGQPTGWAAMAEDIKKYDSDKIDDCKEDIDTLMTFSGLFSAAITAFLVDSYEALLPNQGSETLLVLRHIAQQNDIIIAQNPSANTTNLDALPPASSSPFADVTSSLVIVNILWFASLLVSLIAASFGMLVKQWLREYLAVNNPSAQARLRVRQYREPSLSTWKVFEIAAALPFLLQLALGLFFAGLCLFTASVHSAVGRTTTTIVLAWAFCFLVATALPAFFPKCPYKTAFLVRILRATHRMLCTIVGSKAHIWHDESRISRDTTRDLEILIDVDELQANDELLETTIFACIDQFHKPTLGEVVNFLKHILTHRCQIFRADNSPVFWPVNADLLSLSDRCKKVIQDIIVQHGLDSKAKPVSSSDSKDRHGLLAFLTLPNLHPLNRELTQHLKAQLREISTDIFSAFVAQWATRYRGRWRTQANNRSCLEELLLTVEYLSGQDCLALSFSDTYKLYLNAIHAYSLAQIPPIGIASRPIDTPTPAFLPYKFSALFGSLAQHDIYHAAGVLSSWLKEEFKSLTQDANHFPESMDQAIAFVLWSSTLITEPSLASYTRRQVSAFLVEALSALPRVPKEAVLATCMQQEFVFDPYKLYDGLCAAKFNKGGMCSPRAL